jgi:diaminohydroxyphosphoribosylaminopyrimidine deaminase/5-amino-6-(5-phosphoribosylamino)uracil reductase
MDAIAKAELALLETLIPKPGENLAKGQPWVTLSFGMSLDGKIATRTGESKYISGAVTRQFVHELRHRHDAILVGIQTVILDQPLLTTRLEGRKGKDAHRIILDSSLRMNLDQPMLHSPSEAKTFIVAKANQVETKKVNQIQRLGVTVLLDPTKKKHIHLPWLMKELPKYQIHSILVEGGGTVHESFIRAQWLDRLYAQVSPMLIGGKNAKTPVEGLGFATLIEATRVAFCNHFQSGTDIIIVAMKEQGK